MASNSDEINREDSEKALQSFLNTFKLRSKETGGRSVLVSDCRDPNLPDFIHWNDAGVISFLFAGRKIDKQSAFILDHLLSSLNNDENGEKIDGDGDIPVLTALASQLKGQADAVTRLSRLVLERNANPTNLSRKSCRLAYTAPDALAIAADAHCVPMVRTLLCYWWPSPVYLLDSWAGRKVENFKFLFPLVGKFGWPHGKRICSVISNYVDKVIILKKDDTDINTWKTMKEQIETRGVSSLKQLSRISVRESIGRSASGGQDFYQRLMKLKVDHIVPPTLHNYLLLKEM